MALSSGTLDGVFAQDPASHVPLEDLHSSGQGPAGRLASISVSRRHVWVAGTTGAVLLLLSGQPIALGGLCLVLAAMGAAAVAPAHGGAALGLGGCVPAGFILLISWGMVWGLGCGALGVGAWSTRSASLVGVVLFCAATGSVVLHRGGRVTAIGRDTSAVFGFLGLGAFFMWVVATQPLESWSRINGTGTDFLRHLRMLRGLRDAGALAPGELTYPRALHALGAWLSGALGTGTDADTLWRAVAPLGFLMLGLMLMSIMIIATSLADHLSAQSWSGPLAAVLSGAVFLQTAWLDTFLSLGSIMNMLVGVALLALLVFGTDVSSFTSSAGAVVCAASLAVVGNSWQLLLPVITLAALPWFVQFLRHGRRRPAGWVAWVVSALLVIHGTGVLSSAGAGVSAVVATSSMVSVSLLSRPEWWWFVGVATAAVTCVLVTRRGWPWWGATFAGMLGGAVATVAILIRLTGSQWDLLLYYPAKALWTALVVVIPVASAGAVHLAGSGWRSVGRGSALVRTCARGGLAMVLFVILVGVLGRGFAFTPHLAKIAQGQSGGPNWSLAVIDALGPVSAEDGRGALVFGVVPGADVSLARGTYLGAVDSMVMEAIDHVGVGGAHDDPIKGAIMQRDMEAICGYLREHPRALRITGPNPNAGPEWILGSGCPPEVVRPESWIVLGIDPQWLDRSPWDAGNWIFPTFAEVDRAKTMT